MSVDIQNKTSGRHVFSHVRFHESRVISNRRHDEPMIELCEIKPTEPLKVVFGPVKEKPFIDPGLCVVYFYLYIILLIVITFVYVMWEKSNQWNKLMEKPEEHEPCYNL